MTTPLIAGNWKMHGTRESARALASAVARIQTSADVAIFPPFVHLGDAIDAVKGSAVKVGAQDCHFSEKGPHTGDVCAHMLLDLGCAWVILGHSERRADHAETDAQVKDKAEAALNAGLGVILCVGEPLSVREAGDAEGYVAEQLAKSLPAPRDGAELVVAYEPVWAIGTGRVPTLQDIASMHETLHRVLVRNRRLDARVLYGGSVNASNAAEILAVPGVNGVLVGGASLGAESFGTIIAAAGD